MKCSGKQSCEVPIGLVVAAGIHPCPVTVVSYLAASYKCIKGIGINVTVSIMCTFKRSKHFQLWSLI